MAARERNMDSNAGIPSKGCRPTNTRKRSNDGKQTSLADRAQIIFQLRITLSKIRCTINLIRGPIFPIE